MSDNERRTAVRERHLQAHNDALADLVIVPWIDGTTVSQSETVPTQDPVIGEPITDASVCDEATATEQSRPPGTCTSGPRARQHRLTARSGSPTGSMC